MNKITEQEISISNENEYLQMVDHLKSLYDVKEKELEKLKEDNLMFKKALISCFGIVRLLDINNNNILLDENHNSVLVESLRTYLSDFVEYEIINIDEHY